MTRSPRIRALTFIVAVTIGSAGCSAPQDLAETATPTAPPVATPSPERTFADGITAIDCAPSAHSRASAVTVLGPDTYAIGGWNHITGVGSFETVALAPGDYKITAENYTEQPDCGGARALAVVLAKKTYDWDRQHANGMESAFPNAGLTFGDIDDVVLELRIDSDRTSIPTADQLSDAYGDLLSTEELAALDGHQVNLELTLFGTGATADEPFMNAGAIISIDPEEFADGWVRVQVPREDLTFYTEDNYVRTDVGQDAHTALVVQGLRINPETSEGATVRRLVTERGDEFDPQAKPELFKEMAMTISLIEVGRR